MDTLLMRLNDALEVDMHQAQNVYYEVANSKYRQALMEVFLERKEFIRMQLDPTIYESPLPCHQINQMLRALDNPFLPIEPPDESDEESEKMEKAYEQKMGELRELLHKNVRELQQGCDHIKADICRVLRNQQMLRPIDHQVRPNAFDNTFD